MEFIMKRTKKRKKNNAKRRNLIIILIIVIILAILIIVQNNGNSKEDVAEIQDENSSNVEEVVEENTEESKAEHLNNLADDEASFGDLDVPTYKKGEKDIKIPLLIYHGFCTPLPEVDTYKLMCSMDIFEDQITTLKDAGYTFLTLEDIYKYNNGTIGLPEKNVTITMDDGWEGNYTEAFDLIKKYEVPANIFIVENLVGTEGYFSWEQAKEMYDTCLVKIHVHGKQHVSATGYTKEQLINSYNSAHSAIEEHLGTSVQKIMAYPAGDYSDNTIEWLKEAGFEMQVQTKYGTVNKSSSLDLTGLGRIRAERASGASILKTIESK
jgi:peptidoglycan/xylan/chitin deacetylase (PgdA/CDA1 family)